MDYEVIIIGGSYSGMAAAENLGQAQRKVLILDGDDPRNRAKMDEISYGTPEGVTPRQFLQASRTIVQRNRKLHYLQQIATELQPLEEGFAVRDESGTVHTAAKVLLAHGIRDIMLDIPGFADCWTVSILHCPFCYNLKEQNIPIALIGNGDGGHELAELLSHFTDSLHLFTNGPSEINEEQAHHLAHHSVQIHQSPIRQIIHQNGQVEALELEDGSRHPFQHVFARTPFEFRAPFAKQMDLRLLPSGLIEIDSQGRTSYPGLFAAGDICSHKQQILYAKGSGLMAAIGINQDLVQDSIQKHRS